MTSTPPIRLATRGSDLARTQAGSVQDALERRRRDAELVTVETTGDRLRDELIHRLGKTGAFVRALDEEVLDGSVDAAVHSMKDMPTEQPDDLVVAAVPERASANDVLVTPDGRTLEDLPEGATVGTSSLRRGAQLQAERSDLEIEPLRGNVDTRVEKLLAPSLQAERERRKEAAQAEDAGETERAAFEDWLANRSALEDRALDRPIETEYDAIVLAAAGLERVGLLDELQVQHLPRNTFVPAPGQGALAITAAAGSDVVDLLRTSLDHRPTRIATTAERIVLAELGGGCVAPLGVHATLQGAHVRVTVAAYSRDGSESVEMNRDLPAESYASAARSFAREVADAGAAELIEEAKRDASVEAAEDAAASATGEEE
ncbi:porphobilinogen deaminase [Salinarchaeum sp. Harcht-Bsk1]|uniref:hydroxymethylbilane synthase n=1 Tax=Salinarchaeum sp. Harcht-Bsk1 TaxID=1333523 RepID=UPI0003422F94|nr:hydroxymethylbilane synthase [Salinarchaeum sp. Harcht-Bsk1]AGN00683.1 porphobilinogen deaminase [Salinarchaeum sp. Harcht-Bsk1]